MSNAPDPATDDESREELKQRYRAARARIEKRQRIEAGQSGALVYAALAYGDVLDGASWFRRISHIGKLVCIAAVFVIPNLLVWHLLL